jgi:hypothetical protein
MRIRIPWQENLEEPEQPLTRTFTFGAGGGLLDFTGAVAHVADILVWFLQD